MSITAVSEGDTAPAFDLPTDGGGRVSSADLAGKPYVLYFYPKDDTSGCTKQAQGFTQSYGAFKAKGVEVIGISKDDLKSHARFREKYDLAFPLGSDEEGKVVEAYGAWIEKSMYGRTYMGIDRSTFLIDKDGKVARVWRKVKVPGHIAEVLKAAESLA